MAGELSNDRPDLDPVIRALAELRAREAGLSTSEYLTHLVLAASARGPPVAGPGSGSFALTTAMQSLREPDVLLSVPTVASGTGFGRSHFAGRSNNMVHPAVESNHPAGTTTVTSPALSLVLVFNDRIQGAAVLMSAAFLEAAVNDFAVWTTRDEPVPRKRASLSWYDQLIATCLVRSREVRNALVHRWQ